MSLRADVAYAPRLHGLELERAYVYRSGLAGVHAEVVRTEIGSAVRIVAARVDQRRGLHGLPRPEGIERGQDVEVGVESRLY